jgi:dTMP kinase
VFVCIDGIDGSGKSTQTELLVKTLNENGHKAIRLRDPGTTYLGNAVRKVVLENDDPISPIAQMLLFSATKAELSLEIKKYIDDGYIVVVDRWILSTIAYQHSVNGISEPLIRKIYEETCLRPDLSIVLSIAPEKAEARRPDLRDRYERWPLEVKRIMLKAYTDYAGSHPYTGKIETLIVNADLSIKFVHDYIYKTLMRCLEEQNAASEPASATC